MGLLRTRRITYFHSAENEDPTQNENSISRMREQDFRQVHPHEYEKPHPETSSIQSAPELSQSDSLGELLAANGYPGGAEAFHDDFLKQFGAEEPPAAGTPETKEKSQELGRGQKMAAHQPGDTKASDGSPEPLLPSNSGEACTQPPKASPEESNGDAAEIVSSGPGPVDTGKETRRRGRPSGSGQRKGTGEAVSAQATSKRRGRPKRKREDAAAADVCETPQAETTIAEEAHTVSMESASDTGEAAAEKSLEVPRKRGRQPGSGRGVKAQKDESAPRQSGRKPGGRRKKLTENPVPEDEINQLGPQTLRTADDNPEKEPQVSAESNAAEAADREGEPAKPSFCAMEKPPKYRPSTPQEVSFKQSVLTALQEYRNKNGLGCLKKLAKKAGIYEESIRYILSSGKVAYSTWIKLGKALGIE